MSTPPEALDVRPLPAGRKASSVLATIEALEVGDSFVLVDDRDPHVLRTQLEAAWPGRTQWTALKEGPDVWCMQVTRLRTSV